MIVIVFFQAFKALQQKLIEDRRKSKASEGEFGLYYQEKSTEEEEEEKTYEHPDIQHTAPQHRYGQPSSKGVRSIIDNTFDQIVGPPASIASLL